MDRFREMATFAAVVDAASFVGAARQLGQSKTAVSRLVSDLEARLGARLLNRTTRRLSLTDVGRDYHERCRAILADVDEADASASSASAEPTGVLRVNAPLTFGILHLAPLWPRFAQRHPQLRLDVTLSDRLVDLVDEGFDLAVRISRMPASTLVSRKLADTEMLLCASPGYLRRHGRISHPSALTAHPVVAYSYWTGPDDWQFDGPTGPVSVRIRPVMVANNGDTCRAAALAGLGVVLQPSFLVAGDLAARRLVRLCPDWHSLTLGVHAVYPSRRHLPSKVRLMVDFLADALASQRW
jgi:DNA-binding transcriptional LysR family regulator